MQQNESLLFHSLRKSLLIDDKLVFAGTLLQRAYQRSPDKMALMTKNRTITYKELYFRSILLSKSLAHKGVGLRDKVILLYENSLEFYIGYFAILQLGAIVVPVNIFLHEKELAYIISDAVPAALIVSPILQSKLETLVQEKYVESLPPVFGQDSFDWKTEVPQNIAHVIIPELAQDELCVLLYTSGTTGTPKGVMLSSKNIITNVLQGYARFVSCGMTQEERFFCVLPLFHVFAQNTCLWLPLVTGSTVIVVNKIDRKFILEGLEQRPTLFFGFPALYGLLCLMKTAPLDSIKIFISGADMLPDKIREAFALIYGRKICSGYGLSEASPVVAVNHYNDAHVTTVVGQPLVGIECEIRNEQGQQMAVNEIGTLWIKGENVMQGYYKAPEATNQVVVNGWLNTGDLARKDVNGNLAICGRNKDIIIHKGFNIYPAEVENVLLKHPAVIKAAVIAQEEPFFGQIPIAFVALKKHDKAIEASLRNFCSQNLASYKIPRKFICLNDLPMNNTGKIDKKQLQKSSFLQEKSSA